MADASASQKPLAPRTANSNVFQEQAIGRKHDANLTIKAQPTSTESIGVTPFAHATKTKSSLDWVAEALGLPTFMANKPSDPLISLFNKNHALYMLYDIQSSLSQKHEIF